MKLMVTFQILRTGLKIRYITYLCIEINSYKVSHLGSCDILYNFLVPNFVRTLHSTYITQYVHYTVRISKSEKYHLPRSTMKYLVCHK